MATDETFTIGNGKTAKVGDKVWDSTVPGVLERTVERIPQHETWRVRLNAGRAFGHQLFLTRAEAMAYRLHNRRKTLHNNVLQRAKLAAEISSLEALLEKESTNV